LCSAGSLCFRPHGTYIITASIVPSAVVLILRKAFVADVREGSTTFLLLEHHASTSLFSNSDDDGYIIEGSKAECNGTVKLNGRGY